MDTTVVEGAHSAVDAKSGHRQYKTPRYSMPRAMGPCLPYLRSWREWRMFSVGELASEAGVSRATIWRAERPGERVTFRMARTLARAMGIEASMLIYGEAPARVRMDFSQLANRAG